MNRLANWDSHLVDFARGVVGEDFEWGTTDCASLVRRGLVSILGEDVWREYVRVWKTRRGAWRASQKMEPEHVLKSSGAVEVGTKSAWSGDVALGKSLDDHNMVQLSLLLPARKALTSTPDRGVVIVDKLSLTEGTRFWRYGG